MSLSATLSWEPPVNDDGDPYQDLTGYQVVWKKNAGTEGEETKIVDLPLSVRSRSTTSDGIVLLEGDTISGAVAAKDRVQVGRFAEKVLILALEKPEVPVITSFTWNPATGVATVEWTRSPSTDVVNQLLTWIVEELDPADESNPEEEDEWFEVKRADVTLPVTVSSRQSQSDGIIADEGQRIRVQIQALDTAQASDPAVAQIEIPLDPPNEPSSVTLVEN